MLTRHVRSSSNSRAGVASQLFGVPLDDSSLLGNNPHRCPRFFRQAEDMVRVYAFDLDNAIFKGQSRTAWPGTARPLPFVFALHCLQWPSLAGVHVPVGTERWAEARSYTHTRSNNPNQLKTKKIAHTHTLRARSTEVFKKKRKTARTDAARLALSYRGVGDTHVGT